MDTLSICIYFFMILAVVLTVWNIINLLVRIKLPWGAELSFCLFGIALTYTALINLWGTIPVYLSSYGPTWMYVTFGGLGLICYFLLRQDKLHFPAKVNIILSGIVVLGSLFHLLFIICIMNEVFRNLSVTGYVYLNSSMIKLYICLYPINFLLIVAGVLLGKIWPRRKASRHFHHNKGRHL